MCSMHWMGWLVLAVQQCTTLDDADWGVGHVVPIQNCKRLVPLVTLKAALVEYSCCLIVDKIHWFRRWLSRKVGRVYIEVEDTVSTFPGDRDFPRSFACFGRILYLG